MATDGAHPEPGSDAGIEELHADIERTRHELGETVSALADKVDVPARVRESVAETRGAAVEQAHRLQHTVRSRPGLDAAVVIAVLVAVGAVVWSRRRR